MRNLHYLILAGCVWLASCKKDDDTSGATDRRTVSYVVSDNFNLSYFTAALRRTGLEAGLKEKGPFTVLAPSDDAYVAANYRTVSDLLLAPYADVYAQTHYLLLKGDISLAALPLEMNQPFPALPGTEVFVSRSIKNADTITTVNGSRLLRSDIGATNGKVQILNKVLLPLKYKTTDLAVADRAELTLFHQALVRSGLLNGLQTGTFTVFAPNNAAVRSYGYADMQAINAADPAVLAAWVKYHLVAGRNFTQDYFLRAETGKTSIVENMYDGTALTINILSQSNIPNSFTGITLRGANNTSNATVVTQDILSGNGMVHVIDQVLRP